MKRKAESLCPHPDERQRRLVLGAEARELGRDGVKPVVAAARCRRTRLSKGCGSWSLERRRRVGCVGPAVARAAGGVGGVGRPGGPGRSDVGVALDVEVHPHARGQRGHQQEGTNRDYKNNGQEWMPQAKSERVQVHDFPDPKVGKAIPYGTYDVAANTGWLCPSARTTSPPPSPLPRYDAGGPRSARSPTRQRIGCWSAQLMAAGPTATGSAPLTSREVVVDLIGATTIHRPAGPRRTRPRRVPDQGQDRR